MNDQVAGYRGLVVSLADELGYGEHGWRSETALLSRDDLIQEGLINVWQTLLRGTTPSREVTLKRMLDYIRWARSKKNQAYETANPLEDLRGIPSRPEVSR